MNIEKMEKSAKEFVDKPTALNHTKFIQVANPAAILELIRDNKSRRNMLDMVINSVAAALERAGVKDVDDPGEAIDVLAADKDAEIARLREALESCLTGLDIAQDQIPARHEHDEESGALWRGYQRSIDRARAALAKSEEQS